MGQHTVRDSPLWERMQSWWQEYFCDNPVVWLLLRQYRYEFAQGFGQIQTLQQRLAVAQASGDPQAVQAVARALAEAISLPFRWQFWERRDLWKGALAWLLGISLLVANIHYGWSKAIITMPPFVLDLVSAFVVLFSMMQATFFTLLYREKQMGTLLFLRITRLDSRYFVYGTVIVNAFLRGLKTYLIYLMPFVWFLFLLRTDSLPIAFYGTIVTGWVVWSFAVLMGVLGSRFLAKNPTALMYTVLYTLYTLVLLLFAIGGFALAWVWVLWIQRSDFADAPMWGWLFRGEWWASFHPSVAVGGIPFVRAPLWGWVHGLIYLGLARLLLPSTLRHVQAVLNHPEYTEESVKGEWG